MNEIEIMTGQGSHASLVVAIVTAGVTLGSITEALANGKAYDRSSHLGRGSKVERDFGQLGHVCRFLRRTLLGSQGQRILSLF